MILTDKAWVRDFLSGAKDFGKILEVKGL